jgi:hypothetical protein
MFTFSIFIDIYLAYVDAIDTSRTNVDVSYKSKHIVVNRPWRTEIRAGHTKGVYF